MNFNFHLAGSSQPFVNKQLRKIHRSLSPLNLNTKFTLKYNFKNIAFCFGDIAHFLITATLKIRMVAKSPAKLTQV